MHLKNLLPLTIALVFPLLTTQCASRRIDATEKASITGVRVPQPDLKKGSLQMPSVISNQTASTLGLVSGLTGGLVGGLVVGTAVVATDASYKKNHAAEHQSLNAPAGYVQRQLNEAMTASLKQSPFFGPKLSSKPSHQLRLEVRSYGLQNLGGKEKHGPSIFVMASIIDDHGAPASDEAPVIWQMPFVATGDQVSPTAAVAPLQTYLAQPALLEKDFRATAAQLAEKIRTTLDESVAE